MERDMRVLGRTRLNAGREAEVDEKPRSVYEIVTRRMLEELRDDVAEVKGRVNALLWLMAGAILAEFVLRIVR